MRLALLQLNQIVGDLSGNAARIAAAVRQAQASGADLCVTPELSLMGYPPRDLLLNAEFVARAASACDALAADLADAPPTLVGLAEANPSAQGRPLFNVAALLRDGRTTLRFRKSLLPTYDVFDEDRYFEPGRGLGAFSHGGAVVAVSICEDVWNDEDFWGRRLYAADPIEHVGALQAEVLINLSGSPFTKGKQALRERMLGSLARKHNLPLVYVNQVGGNDDLVFDGRSTVYNRAGELMARAAAFAEDIVIVNTTRLRDCESSVTHDRSMTAGAVSVSADLDEEDEILAALVLGVRDYARKCGFTRALLGLSGGVDSAVTAALACEAIGPANVRGVLMPSPFSSRGSVDDAVELAARLGIETVTLPIEPAMRALDDTLKPAFAGRERDVTEENIQARIRGALLMAIANKTGALLLTTGNKSELAVGYCTLYGDMCGGLAAISDVPKTMVYRLARRINARRMVIPENTLTKPPSAELRPDQTDQDSLPPYDVLDAILERHIERREGARQIIEAGFDEPTVNRVLDLVRRAEFKRRQAAPGIKVMDRAFGVGWRMPIAAK